MKKISELLQKEVVCSCGQKHSCKVGHVIIEKGAVNRIAELTEGYQKILLVCDDNTYRVCGEKAEKLLGDRVLHTLIFHPEGVLVPDESSIAKLESCVEEDTDLIIGAGSGVINDLCKYVSFCKKLPYMIVATAPSMDGFASVGAAMIIGNMKITYNAHVPEAIIGDVDVLKDAPMDLIQSGYGDIIGKFSCLNDWKLSRVIRNEYFCQEIYDLTYEMLMETKDLGPKLLTRDADAVEILMNALVGVGVAMAYAGNSRPASGSEHHLSHFFEVIGIMKNEPYFAHGTDVIYSSVYTQKMREKLLALSEEEIKRMAAAAGQQAFNFDWAAWEQNIRDVYDRAAEGVIALQHRLNWYEQDDSQVIVEKWQQIREVLQEVPASETLAGYAESVGLDMAVFEELYGSEKIQQALLFAKDLKDRYSVLWLNFLLFGSRGPVHEGLAGEEPADVNPADEKQLPLKIATGNWYGGHIQGIAIDRKREFIYCSFTTEFIKLDMDGNLVGSVKGFTGHLGCMAYNEADGRVYASLEYKNDSIGQGIRKHLGLDGEADNAFYVAIFDVDKINRVGMDAQTDGVVTTVWLREVVEDYLHEWQDEKAVSKQDARKIQRHRYGCSGIDGITFAPAFEGEGMRMYVAYGIYGDVERTDNDCQVLLSYDPAALRAYEAVLTDGCIHTSGPDHCENQYFVPTGNTVYGIQNLEYDPVTGDILAAVYRGQKEEYPNFDMYVIAGGQTPQTAVLPGYGDTPRKVLQLAQKGLSEKGIYGYRFAYGSTGMISLGDGRFYFSEEHYDNGAHSSEICLYRYTQEAEKPFVKI